MDKRLADLGKVQPKAPTRAEMARAEMEKSTPKPSMFQTKSEMAQSGAQQGARMAQSAAQQGARTAQPAAQQVRSDHMQFLVSAKVAKIIIGVNGYTVRQIERLSGCTVQVKRDGQGGPTAIVSLLGNHQAACQVIEEFLRREGCSLRTAQCI